MVDRDSSLLTGKLSAQIRLGHKGAPAHITQLENDSISVEFEEPQFASTPGQILVLYDGDGVVASAVIDK